MIQKMGPATTMTRPARNGALAVIAVLAVIALGTEVAHASNVSADGSKVVFTSIASNLVANDTNDTTDVFLRNLPTGKTRRVSVSSTGAQGNGFSESPSISADGRRVVFTSNASNLVPGDTNNQTDIFVRNLKTGKTRRVSVSSGGVQGNDSSFDTAISADGRRVAFRSNAANLVPNDTNNSADIFVRNLKTGKTRRVSVGSGGAQGNSHSFDPAISANGSRVAFRSNASNLVAGDTNDRADVFLHNLKTGKTRRVSVGSGGAQGDGASGSPSISADGRRIAFTSSASNLVGNDTNGADDVFLRNLKTGKTRRVSVSSGGAEGSDNSRRPAISADGRRVAFNSEAENLVPGDTNNRTDIFVRNLKTGKTRRVSVSSGGVQGNDHSFDPAISADGRRVAFDSEASNLVARSTSGIEDIFVRNLKTGKTRLVSLSSGGAPGNDGSCMC